jgi:hypothetical protein
LKPLPLITGSAWSPLPSSDPLPQKPYEYGGGSGVAEVAPSTAPRRTRKLNRPPDPSSEVIYDAGGPDPKVCHILRDGRPLCGEQFPVGGLFRDSHLIVGEKAKDNPCPACGRQRCVRCGEIATEQ